MSDGKIIRGMLECAICFEPFQDESVNNGSHVPHILPKCGHTFCYSCLATMRGPSHCSTCRVEFEIQPNTLKTNYPKNFQLLEHISLMNDRDKEKAGSQQPPKCEGGEDCGAVDVYCPDCEASFCNACFTSSHILGKAKLHKAVPWSQAVAISVPTSSRVCTHHPEFPLNIVCQESTCPRKDSLMCLMCEKFGPEHKGHASDTLVAVVNGVRGQLYELLGAVTKENETALAALVRTEQMLHAIEPSANNCSNASAVAVEERGGAIQQAIDALNADRDRLHQAIDNRINALIEAVVENGRVRTTALAAQAADLRQFVSLTYLWIEANHERLRSNDDFALMKSFVESKEAILAAAGVPRWLQPVYDANFTVTLPSQTTRIETAGQVDQPVKTVQKEVSGLEGIIGINNVKSPRGVILGKDQGLLDLMDRMFTAPAFLKLLRTCDLGAVMNINSAKFLWDLLAPHVGKNIVVLVRSVEGHVFGAYVQNYRNTNTWEKGSDENFLFALGNLTGKPIKLFPNSARTYGVLFDAHYGICFGDGRIEFGLFYGIQCLNTKPKGYTVVAPGFDASIPFTPGMISGNIGDENFVPDVVDIFLIKYD